MHRQPLFARASTSCGLFAVVCALCAPAVGADRYALLVGINEYQHTKLTPLNYAVNDVSELGKLLESAGYKVTLLTDVTGKKDEKTAPTKANIEKRLHELVRGCQRGDTLLLALAGHGLQFGGQKDAYFCPIDARPLETEIDTLVSITKLYTELDASYAGVKIVLVDACRNDPTPGRGRGLDADSAPSPPKGVGVLFSCSAGQRAFEHDSLKHGVFFHYILQGLENDAIDAQREVTFEALAQYVRRQVPKRVHELFPDQKPDQSPNLKADLTGAPPVLLSNVKRRPVAVTRIRAWYVRDAYQPDAEKVGLNPTRGAVLMHVMQDASPKTAPRLQPGDVIVSINGQQVANHLGLLRAVLAVQTRVATWELWRAGHAQQIEVAIARTGPSAELRAEAEQGGAYAELALAGAISHSRTGDRTEANKWYRRSADHGAPEAMLTLGRGAAIEGNSLPKDRAEGLRWIQKASDLGLADAQILLAGLYAEDESLRDQRLSREWYTKAAKNDHRVAQTHVGLLLSSADASRDDLVAATRWLRLAADAGDSRALVQLGKMYWTGRGVARDYAVGFDLVRRSAEQGYAAGEAALGDAYRNGLGVAKDYSKAVQYLRKAAEKANPSACVSLGEAYRDGVVEQDYEEAMRWFRKAADKGHPSGQYDVALAYYRGQGVARDYGQAMAWFRKSADNGRVEAKTAIGKMYRKGLGVGVDYTEAMKWLYDAAVKGDANAQNEIASMIESGEGVDRDYTIAMKWRRLAADQDDADAQLSIGFMYFRGLGVEKDIQEAKRWFRKAAAKGGSFAQIAKEALQVVEPKD